MLTGDKGETAQQIGYSCGLFNQGNSFPLYKIDENEKENYDKLKVITEISKD